MKKMLVAFVLLISFVVVSCGPSQKELEEQRINDSIRVADSIEMIKSDSIQKADSIKIADSLANIVKK